MAVERPAKNGQWQWSKALGHFKTISRHRWRVMRYCFAVGLYRQGLLHDLSKFGWTEFSVGVRYYQGNRSPNNAEREDKGLTTAWLHHKGRNKHHCEYWIDYDLNREHDPPLCGMKMPKRYVVEMALDRIAASQIYKGEEYDDSCPLEYLHKGYAANLMDKSTARLLEEILAYLAEHGQKDTFAYIKNTVMSNDYDY